MNRSIFLFPALVATVIAAGSSTPLSSQSIPVSAPTTSSQSNFALRAGDVLRIGVWPNAELGGDFVVEETGSVYLPILGAFPASNIPLDRLRTDLREAYALAIKESVITVTPVYQVGVMGEVVRPGRYQVTPSSSLFDVIGMAGGFSPEANMRAVRIVREGQTFELDAWRTLESGEGLHATSLQSGDQIVIGRRGAPGLSDARNLLFLLQSVLLAVNLAGRF